MPHTTSPKRLAANRANAARSTGPRTPEGKARSSQNARKHTFTPKNYAVIRLEPTDILVNLCADLVACYQPVNSQELFALERVALAQLSLLRSAALENGLFTACLNETISPEGMPQIFPNEVLTGDLEVTRAHNRNFCLAEGFTQRTRNPNAWTFFLRYQAQSERLYRRAVEDFERVKKLRSELPNEPLNEPGNEPTAPSQPEENKPESPPEAEIRSRRTCPIPRPLSPVPPPFRPASPPIRDSAASAARKTAIRDTETHRICRRQPPNKPARRHRHDRKGKPRPLVPAPRRFPPLPNHLPLLPQTRYNVS